MKDIIPPCAVLAATLGLALPAQAAAGSLTRTFVSSAGNDANPCTITQPCATFAHAYSLTQANGIIAALDPGKYGPLTITGPVTINGNGWAAITAPANGVGIQVFANNANGDVVNLSGLEIDGAGAGSNGISFFSGRKLSVSNCIIGNFVAGSNNDPDTGNGILLVPNGDLFFTFDINNTVLRDNASEGLHYHPQFTTPQVMLSIDHVVAKGNNDNGIFFDMNFGTSATTNAHITNSVVDDNSGAGIEIDAHGSTMTVAIDNAIVTGNTTGISADTKTHVLLGRSIISGNFHGIANGTSPNTFFSYSDNRINGNTADIATGPGTLFPLVTTPTQ